MSQTDIFENSETENEIDYLYSDHESENDINMLEIDDANDLEELQDDNEKDSLKNLLHSWGVSEDGVFFLMEECKINIKVIECMFLEDIESLFKSATCISDKILFRYGVFNWRRKIDKPIIWLKDIGNIEKKSSEPTFTSATTLKNNNEEHVSYDVQNILQKSPQGSLALDY